MTRVSARSAAALAPGQLAAMGQPRMKEEGRGGLRWSVTNLANRLGYDLVFHAYKSFHAAERGWPDLVLVRVRDRRLLFIELKAEGKSPTVRQAEVLEMLRALVWPPAGVDPSAFRSMPRVEVHVWKPAEWHDGTIERALR
jgi:hypothetical protein